MYVGEVSSVNAERVPAEAAEAAVGRLREMSADLRGCALIGPGGHVLAATGEADRWEILRKYYLALPVRKLRNASRFLRGTIGDHGRRSGEQT